MRLLITLARWRVGILILALIGCYLPWQTSAITALTANVLDLAEWVSLSPLMLLQDPNFLPPFLLRATFALLAVLIGLRARATRNRPLQIGLWVLALILALTLFPPVKFLTSERGNPNYQQLMALTVITLIALAAIWIARRSALPWMAIEAGIAILALVFAVNGLTRAFEILSSVRAPTAIGIGFAITALSLAGCAILAVLEARRPIRRTLDDPGK